MNSADISLRKRAASARFLSTLIATMDKPLSPYRRCISFIHGNERRQGPHHDAQKSTYTTLPRMCSRLTESPAAVGSANDGARSPTSTAPAFVAAIDGECVLDQIVRADREEVELFQERVHCEDRRRNFDHAADGDPRIEWSALLAQRLFGLREQRERLIDLGHRREHRDQDLHVS